MRVSKIEKIDSIYHVTTAPNFIQRLFGVKSKTTRYRWNYAIYTYGFGKCYIREDGNKVDPWSNLQDELTKFDNKF